VRKLSVALLAAISLTLGACSTSGSNAGSPPTSVPATSTPVTSGSSSTSSSTGTVSQETQQLNQELANLQTLLGQTNADFAAGQQDS
jgi:hypothetical protein